MSDLEQYAKEHQVPIMMDGGLKFLLEKLQENQCLSFLELGTAIARTSATPGKTQTINFYNINDIMYLVDLPGYGYAKVSEKEKIQWGKLIERYLHSSKQLKAVFLLIDIRHDPSANDKMMYEWIVSQGYNPIIIATKLDKLKRSQVAKHVKMIKQGLDLVPGTQIIPFSSVSKQGREEIWELVEKNFLNETEVG